MDLERLTPLWLLPPALGFLWWAQHRTLQVLPTSRRRALLAVRAVLVALVLLALCGPGGSREQDREAVIFVLDHSQSLGEEGVARAESRASELLQGLPAEVQAGFVSAGSDGAVLRLPSTDRTPQALPRDLLLRDGHQSHLSAALELASGLFPAGAGRRIVLLSDGMQTGGDLEAAARDAALKGIVVDTVAVHGPRRMDARVLRLRPSRARSHEGATLALSAEIESTISGPARLRLFENGVEVENREIVLEPGAPQQAVFQRTPEERNLYRYLVRIEGVVGDELPGNDEAMALVDVRGRPLLLLIEDEVDEARYLVDAMAREGIRLHLRPPEAIPTSLQELAVYDGVILSDVPAYRIGEHAMTLIHDYVEQLGGGFLMIGGVRSFGVGGYYRTPIEDILPVRMQPPDRDERYSTALALVVDKSGSMEGLKMELCKSAAVATAQMLAPKDLIGVVAFDADASWIVPMTRAGRKGEIEAQVATLAASGGTNIFPGMTLAQQALREARARVKHMIVLTDGHTQGGAYEQLAAELRGSGITVSTVGVGDGADNALLERIAAAGGGKHYATTDPSTLPKIFTQDAATHLGRLVREEAFQAQQAEEHPMLAGWPVQQSPPMLGYVKTLRKATTQVPLVTDLGDPLLAHWRFGLGKVTAFTSDCKTRWAALWIAQWGAGYSQFWGQVLREMARAPQGQHLDLRVEREGAGARIVVDALEDPARFKNAATVEADVYFVPRGALGSALRLRQHLMLEQTGPGRYTSSFLPAEPGVYLVRARSEGELVSAGLVHEVSGEVAGQRIDESLLARVRQLTGGSDLAAPGSMVPPRSRRQGEFVDLTPLLLVCLLLLFLVDLGLRRTENVLGLWDGIAGWIVRMRR